MSNINVREEEMKQNEALFKRVREENEGRKQIIPYYSEEYWKAKELLEKRVE